MKDTHEYVKQDFQKIMNYELTKLLYYRKVPILKGVLHKILWHMSYNFTPDPTVHLRSCIHRFDGWYTKGVVSCVTVVSIVTAVA